LEDRSSGTSCATAVVGDDALDPTATAASFPRLAIDAPLAFALPKKIKKASRFVCRERPELPLISAFR
jgi:hypothetical protein